MFDKLKQMLISKKFIAMIAGLIVAFAARKGLSLDETEVAGILLMFISYILAQGQADRGKEAAKVEAIAGVATRETAAKQIEEIKSL